MIRSGILDTRDINVHIDQMYLHVMVITCGSLIHISVRVKVQKKLENNTEQVSVMEIAV